MKKKARNEKQVDRIVNYLQSAINDSSQGLADVPRLIERIIREEIWRERFVAQIGETVRFDSFSDFVTSPPPDGLGVSLKNLYKFCSDSPQAVDLLNQIIEQPGHGGDRKSDKFKSDNVTVDKPHSRGNSTAYSLKRLRNKCPDLHRKVLSGEISANQAMIRAGLRKRPIRFPGNVERLGEIIKEKFSSEQIRSLIKLLKEMEELSSGHHD